MGYAMFCCIFGIPEVDPLYSDLLSGVANAEPSPCLEFLNSSCNYSLNLLTLYLAFGSPELNNFAISASMSFIVLSESVTD